MPKTKKAKTVKFAISVPAEFHRKMLEAMRLESEDNASAFIRSAVREKLRRLLGDKDA